MRHDGIINSFLKALLELLAELWFPSPESGIINSFSLFTVADQYDDEFPSPESGIINSFPDNL